MLGIEIGSEWEKKMIEELSIEWQAIQIPIFKHLIENNQILSDFEIKVDNEDISIEKKYTNNGKNYWVHIAIEDSKTVDDINYYVLSYLTWLPVNLIKSEQYLITSHFENFDEMSNIIKLLNNGEFYVANKMMKDKSSSMVLYNE